MEESEIKYFIEAALLAAGDRNEAAIDDALEESPHQAVHSDRVDRLRRILNDADIKHGQTDGRATEYTHQAGIERQHRHHDDQSDYSWHDQEVDRMHAESCQCVDLLVDLHRADLRRVGCTRAAGHDDRGHQRRHFPHHTDTNQIGDIDLGAELGQLVLALDETPYPCAVSSLVGFLREAGVTEQDIDKIGGVDGSPWG